MTYQEFLANVADEVDRLITKPKVKERFVRHVGSYLNLYRKTAKKQNNAGDWLFPYRLWTDDSTSSTAKSWSSFRMPTVAEKLDVQYTLLAILHDGQRQGFHPTYRIYFDWKDEKFFTDKVSQLAGCVWTAWLKNPIAFEGRESYCRNTIEKVLNAVRDDLQQSQLAKGETTKKWYQSRTLQATIIMALVTIAGWFLIPFITKHSGPIQKNVLISPEVETGGNLSPAVVTSGPNSPVNIYLTPGQSETRSEVNETDINRPK